MFAVKDSSNGVRAKKDTQVDPGREQEDSPGCIAEDGMKVLLLSGSVIAAEDGLDSLGDPGVDSDHYQRDVGDYTVCSHSDVPCQSQDQDIKDNDHDPRGNFRDQGRDPAGEDPPDFLQDNPAFLQMKMISFL